MKRIVLSLACLLLCIFSISQQNDNAVYKPSQANVEARKNFRNMKYGMFIHWGAFSVLCNDAWEMNNRNIHVKDYKQLVRFFNPVKFNAHDWVSLAKNAGMKYITFITRHHDGFSNWDTKQSDWKITNTPFGKDAFKMLADECHKQGIKLFVYYSLLDWSREDYPWETGRTGKGTGRTSHGNYDSYLQFMKAQLTELLTNYGEIAGVWFDGHWDQTEPEGAKDRTSRINWHYNEIYSTIHKLQPQCLIGNNHHLVPFEGEDFQMFEHDLPGQNNSGLSFQKPSEIMPLESCETMNDSWGFNIADRKYKTQKQIIHILVNAAGRDANLLLNVGPMPNGEIQQQFRDTLKAVSTWLQKYGNTVYGTRGAYMKPQSWGVMTGRNKTFYVHIMEKPDSNLVFIPGFKAKILKALSMNDGSKIKFKQQADGTYLFLDLARLDALDTIFQLETE